MNTPQYIIQSRAKKIKEEDLDFSDDAKRYYKEQAYLIKKALEWKNVYIKMIEIVRGKYFVQYYSDIKIKSNPEDIVKNIPFLKMSLNTPYLQVRYPVRKRWIMIETPNQFTEDTVMDLNIDSLKILDFQFLKALDVTFKNNTVDLRILREEIDNISDENLRDIFHFLQKEDVLSDQKPLEEIEYSKFWKKWRITEIM